MAAITNYLKETRHTVLKARNIGLAGHGKDTQRSIGWRQVGHDMILSHPDRYPAIVTLTDWLQHERALYKADQRSRVWLTEDPLGQRWVIKRFVHNTLRQRIAWITHLHPAQREAHCARQLSRIGLPVVPIQAFGIDRGRAWLMTPYVGLSLQHTLEKGGAGERQLRRWARELGGLTGRMLAKRWWNRDLKTSNLLVDEHGHLQLIDTGGARRVLGSLRKPLIHMIRLILKTARGDLGRDLTPREKSAWLAGLRRHAPDAVALLRNTPLPL